MRRGLRELKKTHYGYKKSDWQIWNWCYTTTITKLVIGFGSIPNTIKLTLEALSNCLVSGLVYDVIKEDICKKGIDSMRKVFILLFGLGIYDGEV